MVYQVKLEIISTVMNFLCIVQVELSFMFAQGVTSDACSVKHKGRREEKFFPINVVIDQTPDRTYVIWPFLYFFFKHVIQDYKSLHSFFLFLTLL